MLPFTSYDNLVANVQETLNRADLASAIPGFVSLTEGEINADDRFRILPSLVRATATINPPVAPAVNTYIPVPQDYIAMPAPSR